MSLSTSGRTWDEASAPPAIASARRFETAWRQATSRARRPDLASHLADAADRPGARLALLRAEMSLRWEDGDRPDAHDYLTRFPDLGTETFVALAYEEFCLREEKGETPEIEAYLERYRDVAPALRRVLEIHGLVGSGGDSLGSTLSRSTSSAPAIPFPRAGETIAGFRLTEELGRGAFARVFKAQERQLADRPVALKVARAGSREPQTLARLQHTHIVPVYSYRTDPATGLHLLCMPYFGRVTLARVLADDKVRVARLGDELIAAIDRLGEDGPHPDGRSTGRAALAGKPYAQAIAWWGARMAEALEHAHDRGVLHRDVKPSNVLLTSDGMPMLLDFNLARAVRLEGEEDEDALPGGTLDYMAPEHIEELGDGVSDRVDARSDVYGLGVLLYEALMGSRPFPPPQGASSATEMLRRAAADRRKGAARPRATRPEVPAALEAVVLRCLEPDPVDRYASAAELAADLQAVADDRPLRHASEPWPDRAFRWARRHRRMLATAVPVLIALAGIGILVIRDRLETNQRLADVKRLYDEGVASQEAGDLRRAKDLFDSASRLTRRSIPIRSVLRPRGEGMEDDLEGLRHKSQNRFKLAERALATREAAAAVDAAAEHLRFRLIGFGGDIGSTAKALAGAFEPFHVYESDDWTRRPNLNDDLDAPHRERLIATVNELLFLYAIALDHRNDTVSLAKAAEVCDGALRFAKPDGPWRALRERFACRLANQLPPPTLDLPPDSGEEPRALESFQWGLLAFLGQKRTDALPWLKRAVRLDEGNYWYHFYLAFANDQVRSFSSDALRHYDQAVALKPKSPYVRFTRARLFRIGGSWGLAQEEFQRAMLDFHELPESLRQGEFESQVRLELGLALQSLGDLVGARAQYAEVIDSDRAGTYARAALLNRAKLDADTGDLALARAEYDRLIKESPDDSRARLGRAMLALRTGDAAGAEADLNAMLAGKLTPADQADGLTNRSLARLALGRAIDASKDVEEALRLRPSPRLERLSARVNIAMGHVGQVALERPEEAESLPLNGTRLRADLASLVGRLRDAASHTDPAAELRMRLTLTVALAVLGANTDADSNRAVALAPISARPYLTRGWVKLYEGQAQAARADAERAMDLEPEDPRAWELRGDVRMRIGDPRGALTDYERAIALGAEGGVRSRRAAALLASGDARGSILDWTNALNRDPDDPTAYLGRAEAFLQLGQWDQALADLEQAAGWTEGRPGLVFRIARAYALCLPYRPQQTPRLIGLLRRAWKAARAA